MNPGNPANLHIWHQRQSEQGFALTLVLAVVVALAIIVTGLWQASQPGWDQSTLERARFQAQLLAESGASLAMHPEVEPGDPVLRQDFGDGRLIEVRVTTEGSRILINDIEDEIIHEAVVELFTLWGVDATSASVAADSLADWIDSNSEARSNGAENEFYSSLEHPEFPPNEAISNIEQMLYVNGMDVVAKAQPLWREYFTLYGDGMIDVNAASADLIQAFFQVSHDAALNLVVTRDGPDGIPGTFDDELLEDENNARAALGVSSQEWDEVSSKVTLEGALRRIESVGSVGEHSVKLIVLSEVSGDGQDQEVNQVARLQE